MKKISLLLTLVLLTGLSYGQWAVYHCAEIPTDAGWSTSDNYPGNDFSISTTVKDTFTVINYYQPNDLSSDLSRTARTTYKSNFSENGGNITVAIRAKGYGQAQYDIDSVNTIVEVDLRPNYGYRSKLKVSYEDPEGNYNPTVYVTEADDDNAYFSFGDDAWHTFRMLAEQWGDKTYYEVYMDEFPYPVITTTNSTKSNSDNYIKFGDAGSARTGGYVDWLAYSTSGAYQVWDQNLPEEVFVDGRDGDDLAPTLTLVSDDTLTIGQPFVVSSSEIGYVAITADTINKDTLRAAVNSDEDIDWIYSYYPVKHNEVGEAINLHTARLQINGAEVPDSFLIYAMDPVGNVSDSIVVWIEADELAPVLTLESGQSSVYQGGGIDFSVNENVFTILITYPEFGQAEFMAAMMNNDEVFFDTAIIAEVIWDDNYDDQMSNAILADSTYSVIISDSAMPGTYTAYAIDGGLNFSNPVSVEILKLVPMLELLSSNTILPPNDIIVSCNMASNIVLTWDTVTKAGLLENIDLLDAEPYEFEGGVWVFDVSEVSEPDAIAMLTTAMAGLYHTNLPDSLYVYAVTDDLKISDPLAVYLDIENISPTLTKLTEGSEFVAGDSIEIQVDEASAAVFAFKTSVTPEMFKEWVHLGQFENFQNAMAGAIEEDSIAAATSYYLYLFDEADAGDYNLYAIDYSFNFSNAIQIYIGTADTTAPELTLDYPLADTLIYGNHASFDVSINEGGAVLILPAGTSGEEDLLAIAYNVEDMNEDGMIDLDSEVYWPGSFSVPRSEVPGEFLLFGIDYAGNISDSLPVYIDVETTPPVLSLISNDTLVIGEPFLVSLNERGMVFLAKTGVTSQEIIDFIENEDHNGPGPDWLFDGTSVNDQDVDEPIELETLYAGAGSVELPADFLIFAMDESYNFADSILVYITEDDTPPVVAVVGGETSIMQKDTLKVSMNKPILTAFLILQGVDPEDILAAHFEEDEAFLDSVIVAEINHDDGGGDKEMSDTLAYIVVSDTVVPGDYTLYGLNASLNFSNAIIITVTQYVNLIQNELTAAVVVYPNPSTSGFNIDLSAVNVPAQLSIYNTSGKLIYSENAIEGEVYKINAGVFPSKGIYLLKINYQHTVHTKMLLVK